MGDLLDSAISQLIGELIMVTPPLPPPVDFVSEPICILVNIIKGGKLEDLPVLGTFLSVFRYGIIITIMTILLIHWVFRYIGPSIWNFAEAHIKIEEYDPGDWGDIPSPFTSFTGFITFFPRKIAYKFSLLYNGIITFLLQIPIDILSWNTESLSLDFGTEWTEPSIFRGNCSRFINGSYSADYTLYQDETLQQYTNRNLPDPLVPRVGGAGDQSITMPGYICIQGATCPEISDIFGQTSSIASKLNVDSESGLIENIIPFFDYEPTGDINAIEISSAPRKYSVCCDAGTVDCDVQCGKDAGVPTSLNDIQNLLRDLGGEIGGVLGALGDDVKCAAAHADEAICVDDPGWYDPLPDCNEAASRRRRWCVNANQNLLDAGTREVKRLLQVCIDNCNAGNATILHNAGCNASYLEQANNAIYKNLMDTIDKDIENHEKYKNINKNISIKKTKWEKEDRNLLVSLQHAHFEDKRQQTKAKLENYNGTDCSKEKLSDDDLNKCFGPFIPAPPTHYPIILKDYFKDLFGNLIKYLIIIYIIFVILYILCLLFSVAGKEAWVLNKEVGMANDVI